MTAYTYEGVLATSQRVNWKIDDIIGQGKHLDFERAFLYLTRIEGLDLTEATGLAQWQIDMACGDAGTKLPAGLAVPSSWPCRFEND